MADLASGDDLIAVRVTAQTGASGITASKNAGAATGRQPKFNFTDGGNITWTVSENVGANRIDISGSVSGVGTPTFQNVLAAGNDTGGNNVTVTNSSIIFNGSASGIGGANVISFGGITGIYRHGTSGGIVLQGNPRFNGSNTTGGGTATLGTNCPTSGVPYTWIACTSADGSNVYVPCWK